MKSLVERFFEARKMMSRMAQGGGMPGMPGMPGMGGGAGRQKKQQKQAKGKQRSGNPMKRKQQERRRPPRREAAGPRAATPFGLPQQGAPGLRTAGRVQEVHGLSPRHRRGRPPQPEGALSACRAPGSVVTSRYEQCRSGAQDSGTAVAHRGHPRRRIAPSPDGRRARGRWWGLAVTAVVVFLLVYIGLNYLGGGDEPTISYTEFSRQVDAGNVDKIYSKGDAIQGQLKKARDDPDGGGEYTTFKTQRPAFADDDLWQSLDRRHVTVTARPVVQQRSLLSNVLLSLAPIVLLAALWIFFARRFGGGPGGAGGMLGRKAPPRPVGLRPGARRTTFADVAGIDEVKGELDDSSTSSKPRAVPPDGREDAPWRAARRLAGHRQDPAGACGGGRGRRAVLLRLGAPSSSR